jgi:4-amino-4-deoxy-L-arabinose transferase-like glycosyltransferase
MRVGTAVLFTALLVGTALRLYPLHRPFIHPDQELLPLTALAMVQGGDWHARFFVYPTGYIYLLRSVYAAMLVWGTHVSGSLADATDLFWWYLDDPQPFLLAARLLSAVAGIVTIALTGSLGSRIAGRTTGAFAALIVAVGVLPVRESHYGSVDATACMLFVAALVASMDVVATGSGRSIVAAAALSGLTAGVRYQAGLVVLAVPTAMALARRRMSWSVRVVWLGVAIVVAFGAFALAAPYTLLEAGMARSELGKQLLISYSGSGGLGLGEILPLAVGWPVCGLAALGLVTLAFGRPAMTAVLLVVVVPYAVAVEHAGRAFARYGLPLVPVVAVFAAGGTSALASLVPRRRGLVGVVIVAAAVVVPCARSVALVRLLAEPDTRNLAGAWLRAHATPGEWIWLPSPMPYVNPTTPMTLIDVGDRLGSPLAAALRARRPQYQAGAYRVPRGPVPVDLVRRLGGLVVTADHPVLLNWASTPAEISSLVHEKGTLVAAFTGLEPESAGATRFERIDANFVPQAGMALLHMPGPTIAIWRLPPESRPPMAPKPAG